MENTDKYKGWGPKAKKRMWFSKHRARRKALPLVVLNMFPELIQLHLTY